MFTPLQYVYSYGLYVIANYWAVVLIISLFFIRNFIWKTLYFFKILNKMYMIYFK